MSTTPDARSNALNEKNALIARVIGDRGLDPGQRIVLASLVDMMDPQGHVEVSASELGRSAGLSKRTILRITPSLEESGHVTVRRQTALRNEYRLNLP